MRQRIITAKSKSIFRPFISLAILFLKRNDFWIFGFLRLVLELVINQIICHGPTKLSGIRNCESIHSLNMLLNYFLLIWKFINSFFLKTWYLWLFCEQIFISKIYIVITFWMLLYRLFYLIVLFNSVLRKIKNNFWRWGLVHYFRWKFRSLFYSLLLFCIVSLVYSCYCNLITD